MDSTNDNNTNNIPKLKLHSSKRLREIENHLEHEISEIVRLRKNAQYNGNKAELDNKDINHKLKAFLNSRQKGNSNQSYTNESIYPNSPMNNEDFAYSDNHYNTRSNNAKNSGRMNDFYNDDYYEDSQYDTSPYPEYQQYENNGNYLPFDQEELQPHFNDNEQFGGKFSSEFVESLLLDALMPAIAQWLDDNIDRIVYKVVKRSLAENKLAENKYVSRLHNDRPQRHQVKTVRPLLKPTSKTARRVSYQRKIIKKY